ncbi:2OG-Fe(II) oxygenase [Aquimarina aquimarini]|uniref:2OG-Fe(II) oxygenase n=1 Tax=Aquimarina aquimarini TaxID=1191734 RepID=UPI000D5536C8|nr:2OG-Fe(II) oxygenase [Aquimarina aquimarini]
MERLITKIKAIDWDDIALNMNEKGYAIIPKLISEKQCKVLLNMYDEPIAYRKTVTMERYRFGLGEYKYFDYPLPEIIQTLREQIYPKLVPIANLWMKVLKMEKEFPDSLYALQKQCHDVNQLKPTPLILKYGKGGYNTLHQDLYGEVYFPLQAVLFLNEPNVDFDGGEFVLMQQIPRAQSKAIVLQPKKGDMLIFTTNFRPIKGKKGYYRANMKHGVSELHRGARHTVGIIFHDAIS